MVFGLKKQLAKIQDWTPLTLHATLVYVWRASYLLWSDLITFLLLSHSSNSLQPSLPWFQNNQHHRCV